ncbi:MAG: MotA/TolQ/ExbB proton channel family protein [Elusimicrobia bacterium]|nr:MotA/TolQ/ExbB proton channel family protein [Elusimicrobiota bacterium]
MSEVHYIEMLRSSFTLIILIFCSIISVTFTLERLFYFRRIRLDPASFLARVKQLIDAGNFKDAAALCDRMRGPIPVVVKTAIVNHQKPKAALEELLGAIRLEERLKMERFLVVLGTLGNTAPFIGLFGTVVGIIKAFRDLALSGTGGPAVVAKGIAEALVATAAGLVVAIPAVIIYNYFMRKVKTISTMMEAISLKILVYLQG